MRAYSSSQSYKEKVIEQCHALTNEIQAMLNIAGLSHDMLPPNTLRKFCERHVMVLAELCTIIQCCAETFSWDWNLESSSLQLQDLQAFDVIDLRTHRMIREGEIRPLPNDATIGECIFTIYPGLHKVQERSNGEVFRIIVTRGTLLGKIGDGISLSHKKAKPYSSSEGMVVRENRMSIGDMVTGSARVKQETAQSDDE